jgi:FixJ family two-component response regulator
MPGMNGSQLQSQLANEGCGISIIFISSFDNRDPGQRARQAGTIAYLCKPFSDTTLIQSIHSALWHDKSDATVK